MHNSQEGAEGEMDLKSVAIFDGMRDIVDDGLQSLSHKGFTNVLRMTSHQVRHRGIPSE